MSVGFDDSLRVGHGQIDQEHQALVSLINEFLQNLVYKQDRNTLDLRYNAICEYAALHFSHEEELMRNNKFHDLCIHEKRHESLLTELRERSRFILGGTDDNLSDIMSFFHDWLVFHIKTSDVKLADFLNRRSEPL